MKRVLTTVVLSWLLAAASGCCCPGPFLHAVGNHVFGPWHCGHRYHGGCGNECGGGCGCGQQDDCCDAPRGNGCGCGGAQFAGGGGYGPGHGYCGDMHSAAAGGCGCGGSCGGCGGDCPWYNTGGNSCCGCWGCGDVYLTDLFYPICDPCWRGGCGRGHGHHGCGCQGGCDSCGAGYVNYGYDGGGPCGGVCNDWGGYASAPQRGACGWPTGLAFPAHTYFKARNLPDAAQRSYASANRSMVAQATRGPWDAPPPPRSQWVMNRDYVVSQPKVVDDHVVESHPKTPAKKTVQASPPTVER